MNGRLRDYWLASFEAMSTSINPKERKRLLDALSLSVTKKNKKDNLGTTASIAYSLSGRSYVGGIIESDTNLLHISSEQSALTCAMHHNDFKVNHVVTLFAQRDTPISPITLKTLVDWGIRTREKIRYTVIDQKGKILFETGDVQKSLPFYHPAPITLSKVASTEISEPRTVLKRVTPMLLKQYALEGLLRNFPTYDSASGYGAAIVTKKGEVYFGGQYSSLEKRTGLHAEMAVVAGALMSGLTDITHLGLVSSKFKDEPCTMCGCCRQFLAELSEKQGWKLKLLCFAKDTPDYRLMNITELLPEKWSSKQWR